jgi:hypothetical protein
MLLVLAALIGLALAVGFPVLGQLIVEIRK